MTKKLIRNISSLTLIHGLNYFFSLAIIPYLLKIYGPNNWGKLIFISTVTNYFIWFTNWGFLQGAVKRIGQINNKQKQNILLFNYWYSQALLVTISLALFLIILSLNYTINGIDRSLYAISFFLILSNAIFPSWYFIAKEQILESAIVQFLPKVISAALIFLLVRNENDLQNYLIIVSFSSLLVSLIGTLVMFRFNEVKFIKPNLKKALFLLKTDFIWFRISFISSLFSLIIPTYLGLFRNLNELAFFNVADKIKSAAIIVFSPISHSLYPRMNYLFKVSVKKALLLAKKSFFSLFLLSALSSLIIFIFSSKILFFIGGASFVKASSFLKIIAFLPLISTMNSFFVDQIIQPNNSGSIIERIYLFNLFLISISIFPAVKFFGFNGIAYLMVISELIMFFMNCYKVNNLFYILKKNL